ncbi:MAG: DEAD/DEAH box helicase [Candidatus Micrarchaeota archaeon]
MRIDSFERLNLKPETARAIAEMGFVKPTPIQCESMLHVFQGEDVIGQAQTGTGKTAVFGIYLTECIDMNSRDVQALILAPTRELAVQICAEIKRIAKYTPLRLLTVYGGVSINPQIDELRRGVHIVVGTPGRILDHIERRTLKLGNVRCLVLDEADRMLDMGFKEDVEKIVRQTSKERQTLLFSATMPREIVKLSNSYQKYPFKILLEPDSITIKHIKHGFMRVDHRDRYRALSGYMLAKKPFHTIIFCRTKRGAELLVGDLHRAGYKADSLHGNMSQRQRDDVMRKFRNGVIRVLVATDLAARGLDVPEVSHVINFNLPEEPDTYTHRVGRTGRVGKSGDAFNIVASDEMGMLGAIERACGIRMEEEKIELGPSFPPPPGGRRSEPSRSNFRGGGRDGKRYGSRDGSRGRSSHASSSRGSYLRSSSHSHSSSAPSRSRGGHFGPKRE